jgi:hypothetical protein
MSMFRKDLHNNTKQVNALNAAAIASSTTTVGNIIDLQGFGAAEFIVQLGVRTDGTYTVLLEEGNDSGLSDAAVVDASNRFGALPVLNASNAVGRVGYRVGAFRYVRLSLVSATVTSGVAAAGAVALLGNADIMPVA